MSSTDRTELDGFVAVDGDRPVGLAHVSRRRRRVEIVTIDAFEARRGVGTRARRGGPSVGRVDRVWLITTNDNVVPQRFYEAIGFRLVAVHEGALERSRELKPEIPLAAADGHADPRRARVRVAPRLTC